MPPFAGPPIVPVPGEHLLELVLADHGSDHQVSDVLVIRR